MRKILSLLFIFPYCLLGYETVVESDEVHYNGETITLMGNVSVENAMGKVTANLAILKKDAERKTTIDFPWIELKQNVCLTLTEGGILRCTSLSFDYTQMTSFFFGSPQVTYTDTVGEIYADRAKVDYQEVNGSLEAVRIILFDNVRLVNMETLEKPASQHALADEVHYFPKERSTILEGKNAPVLFYDQQRDIQLSAYTVRAERDPVTKKETIQGVGNVRFTFGPEELEKIKERFPIKSGMDLPGET